MLGPAFLLLDRYVARGLHAKLQSPGGSQWRGRLLWQLSHAGWIEAPFSGSLTAWTCWPDFTHTAQAIAARLEVCLERFEGTTAVTVQARLALAILQRKATIAPACKFSTRDAALRVPLHTCGGGGRAGTREYLVACCTNLGLLSLASGPGLAAAVRNGTAQYVSSWSDVLPRPPAFLFGRLQQNTKIFSIAMSQSVSRFLLSCNGLLVPTLYLCFRSGILNSEVQKGENFVGRMLLLWKVSWWNV